LLQALQNTATGVRLAAVQALAAFPDSRTSAAVVEALAHDDVPAVRAMAAQTLRILGAAGTIPALEAALADRDPAVQDEARRALKVLGGNTVR
jgi:HEAT repeat protein